MKALSLTPLCTFLGDITAPLSLILLVWAPNTISWLTGAWQKLWAGLQVTTLVLCMSQGMCSALTGILTCASDAPRSGAGPAPLTSTRKITCIQVDSLHKDGAAPCIYGVSIYAPSGCRSDLVAESALPDTASPSLIGLQDTRPVATVPSCLFTVMAPDRA